MLWYDYSYNQSFFYQHGISTYIPQEGDHITMSVLIAIPCSWKVSIYIYSSWCIFIVNWNNVREALNHVRRTSWRWRRSQKDDSTLFLIYEILKKNLQRLTLLFINVAYLLIRCLIIFLQKPTQLISLFLLCHSLKFLTNVQLFT